MKHQTISVTVLALLALPLHAVTTFTGAISNDFNTAGNWDNGIPDTNSAADVDDAGVIPLGEAVTMSASYQTLTGRRIWLTIAGSLAVGSNTLQMASGSTGGNAKGNNGDLIVDGGSVTVGSGGLINLGGVGSDMFIENGGSVSFANGSAMQIQKAIEVNNGTLTIGATTTYSGNFQDELVVGNAGTITFNFDASFNHLVLPGDTLGVELGTTSTLGLIFATAPITGATYNLLTGASGFTGVVGGSGTGVFGTVNATGLAAGQSVAVDYGTINSGVMSITIIPETSAVLLGGLGSLILLRRRRIS